MQFSFVKFHTVQYTPGHDVINSYPKPPGRPSIPYEVLPFEANEEGQDTTPGGQGDAAVGGQGGNADDVHVYANQ